MDEWDRVSKDEYQADRLLSTQDESDWRAARGDVGAQRPTHDEMVAHFAAEQAAAERESLRGVAERAVVRDGWATAYPFPELRDRCLTVHATLRLSPSDRSSTDDVRAQLAGLGFDCIDIEVA